MSEGALHKEGKVFLVLPILGLCSGAEVLDWLHTGARGSCTFPGKRGEVGRCREFAPSALSKVERRCWVGAQVIADG